MKKAGFILLILTIVSCNFRYNDCISGNGKVKINEISTDTITKVVVSDKIDLILIPSDSMLVLLKADENLHDVIDISIEKGVLRISTDKYIRIARAKEVEVYGSMFSEVEATTKASITNRDTLHSNEFSIITNSGANVKINGIFNSVVVNAGSGSDIFLEGKTDFLSIDANSAADIYGFDFLAKSVDVDANSASDVRITVLDEAHLSVSSAADITYKGKPPILDSRSTSLGDIRHTR